MALHWRAKGASRWKGGARVGNALSVAAAAVPWALTLLGVPLPAVTGGERRRIEAQHRSTTALRRGSNPHGVHRNAASAAAPTKQVREECVAGVHEPRAATHVTATASMSYLPRVSTISAYDLPASARDAVDEPPETQSGPGDEEVLLGVHGVLLCGGQRTLSLLGEGPTEFEDAYSPPFG